jgi:hypothetical protein
MRKSKFTEVRIVFALKQSDTGVWVDEICRKMWSGRQYLIIGRRCTAAWEYW